MDSVSINHHKIDKLSLPINLIVIIGRYGGLWIFNSKKDLVLKAVCKAGRHDLRVVIYKNNMRHLMPSFKIAYFACMMMAVKTN